MKISFLAIAIPLVFSAFGCGKSASSAKPVPLPAFTPWPSIEPQQARRLSGSRLKQLALGVILFAQKHDDTFPDMSSADAMRADVYPFLMSGGVELFVHPVTGETYAPNPSLSGKSRDSIPAEKIGKIAMLYEASADGNLTRGVIYDDGHYHRIDESEWPALKAASEIPQ